MWGPLSPCPRMLDMCNCKPPTPQTLGLIGHPQMPPVQVHSFVYHYSERTVISQALNDIRSHKKTTPKIFQEGQLCLSDCESKSTFQSFTSHPGEQ